MNFTVAKVIETCLFQLRQGNALPSDRKSTLDRSIRSEYKPHSWALRTQSRTVAPLGLSLMPLLPRPPPPPSDEPWDSVPVCVLRWAFRWELFVYTLLHPSKSHLWIRRFLESGDSDRLWRLVLSILNGEIELEKETVRLNGDQHSAPSSC